MAWLSIHISVDLSLHKHWCSPNQWPHTKSQVDQKLNPSLNPAPSLSQQRGVFLLSMSVASRAKYIHSVARTNVPPYRATSSKDTGTRRHTNPTGFHPFFIKKIKTISPGPYSVVHVTLQQYCIYGITFDLHLLAFILITSWFSVAFHPLLFVSLQMDVAVGGSLDLRASQSERLLKTAAGCLQLCKEVLFTTITTKNE